MLINLSSNKVLIETSLSTKVKIQNPNGVNDEGKQITILVTPYRLDNYYYKFNKNTQNTLLIAKKKLKYSIICDFFIFLSFN